MSAADFVRLPNLLSLTRIALIVPLGYFISRNDPASHAIAVALVALAGITDGLDGYLARRLNQVSSLGIALDPVADKIFAAALIILLMIFRSFPLWLAAVIIGRDLLILLAGSILLAGRDITLPSNLTGKYAFFSIVMLLLSYIMHFDFGIHLLTPISVVLIAASLFNYGRLFIKVRAGQPAPQFNDKPAYRLARIFVTAGLSILYVVKLYLDVVR